MTARSTSPKAAPRAPQIFVYASTLDEFWLEGKKGKLHPLESALLEACRTGEECIAEDATQNEEGEIVRPQNKTPKNIVRSEFLRFLLLGGCEKSPIHSRGVHLAGAYIVCQPGTYGVKALDLDGAVIPNDFFLNACFIEGALHLRNATTKTFGLSGTFIEALAGERLIVKGSAIFSAGFDCEKLFNLEGSEFSGRLDFHNGSFAQGICIDNAIVEKGLNIGSNKKAPGGTMIAGGSVTLANATIGGNVDCSGGQFLCKDQAFFANRAVIKGDMSFDDAKIEGSIALNGVEIRGGLSFNRAALNGKPSLHLRGSQITGTLFWRDLKNVRGEVDLSGASCTVLSFDKKSWFREFEKDEAKSSVSAEVAQEGQDVGAKSNEEVLPRPFTKLDNFTYKGFNNPPDKADAQFWIDWLRVQPDDPKRPKYRPKPWSQLALVLDMMGYEGEAKAVRIEREHLLTRFMAHHDPEDSTSGIFSLNWWRVQWRRVWGFSVDYGYQPMKALVFLLVLIMVTSGVNFWAAKEGIMAPTHPLIFKEARVGRDGEALGFIDPVCARNWVYFEASQCDAQVPSEYSAFSSLMYSADVAIPVVNLRQEVDWSPRVVDHQGNFIWSGHFVRVWEWITIILGWVLSLMFVSAVGGAIRR